MLQKNKQVTSYHKMLPIKCQNYSNKWKLNLTAEMTQEIQQKFKRKEK